MSLVCDVCEKSLSFQTASHCSDPLCPYKAKYPYVSEAKAPDQPTTASDGSTASYYELPADATELQDLISYRDMNGQMAEIFRACYRYGLVAHSPKLRDAKKIQFYINAEIERLEKYEPQE